MRNPIRATGAALILSAFLLPGLAAAQAPGNPPPAQPAPSQQKPPESPAPAGQEAQQKGNLPVIKPPAQIDPAMVKPAPDAGPNATPVVTPPPGNGAPLVPK